jgi:hypothetical protein
MSSYPAGVTPEEWDAIRQRFKQSMMVKTDISKLGQNVDISWPLKGRDEIPLKYLPLTLDELLMMPGIAEKPDRVRTLVDIFAETMAFDDPFSEMAEHVDSSSKKDDGPRRNLEKKQVPLTYPVKLSGLSKETLGFCEAEEIETLAEFIEFAQNMAQNIVVGGDFRAFLNAMVQMDEPKLAEFIPIRPGKPGLHLAEALGLLAKRMTPSERLYFLEEAQAPITAEDRRDVDRLSPEKRQAARERFHLFGSQLLNYFSEQEGKLRDAFAEGSTSIGRYFVPLDDARTEKLTIEIARLALQEGGEEKETKRGFFSRLFGR